MSSIAIRDALPWETAVPSGRLKVRNRQVDFGDIATDHPHRHIDMDRLCRAIDNVARDDRSLTELNQRIHIRRFIFESRSHGYPRDVERNDFSLAAGIGP